MNIYLWLLIRRLNMSLFLIGITLLFLSVAMIGGRTPIAHASDTSVDLHQAHVLVHEDARCCAHGSSGGSHGSGSHGDGSSSDDNGSSHPSGFPVMPHFSSTSSSNGSQGGYNPPDLSFIVGIVVLVAIIATCNYLLKRRSR